MIVRKGSYTAKQKKYRSGMGEEGGMGVIEDLEMPNVLIGFM
jgi:hypothetical protein